MDHAAEVGSVHYRIYIWLVIGDRRAESKFRPLRSCRRKIGSSFYGLPPVLSSRYERFQDEQWSVRVLA